ncbi:hypothetical protein ASPACDRAFT_1857023 [Aspergillus aculeatus ATCC 16872]|uniref:Uncharacterized protein n=1 Tax=Aspergillus aculeatus (strain ATCC 16872 / CBS 172.66 / WB 5094) TaxID=690307 RepID=A0A1L9WTC7_ASPA1|nr:uncharacterized protein ASPACDRAFT_1857023 [Aspergillus aculeatus ATCC 16872]OJJ99464.1 hypothetical protein ASPACDRAFT_1857023 [Aspergillus aculeatus ATCC 16872]
MSYNSSQTSYFESSSSYSSSSSSNDQNQQNPQTQESGHRAAFASHTDPQGNTTVRTGHQNLGEEPVLKEKRFSTSGHEREMMLAAGTPMGGVNRIQDLNESTGDTY